MNEQKLREIIRDEIHKVLKDIPLDIKRKTRAEVYFLIGDEDGTILKWGSKENLNPSKTIDTENIRMKYDAIKRMGTGE